MAGTKTHREDEEAREKSNLDQGFIRSSSDASGGDEDQERALLEDLRDSEPDVEEDGDIDTGGTPYNRSQHLQLKEYWPHLLAVVSVLVTIILFLVYKARSINPAADRASSDPHARYVLDPHWDFMSSPQRREYHWTIHDAELNPDGVYRPMMVINNDFPGPLIEVNEGDTIVVHVDNQAKNATSIHWHGLYQNGSNWMDGTVGITQCPIVPGNQFTYEFTVDGQSGTYWYHAHQGVQASDGLYGPLVIHSRDEYELQRLSYASDRVVMVSDHYHNPSSMLVMEYLAPDKENAEPVPDGALINGRSIRDCDKLAGRKCDNSTANVGSALFGLEAGKSHRLRFINVGAFAEFQVSIDEHHFAVTEVDGTDVLPSYYNRFNINPAQRYSIIIDANITSANSFWLRAKMLTTCFTDSPHDIESEVRAIVRYTWPTDHGSSSTDSPRSTDWTDAIDLTCHDMNTTELIPARVVAAPQTTDASFYLRSNFEIGAFRLSRGFFNQSSWRPDVKSPSLLRTLDELHAGNQSFSSSKSSTISDAKAFVNDAAFDIKNELVIQSTGIQVIDIIVSNFDDGNHPLHLHGYKYFVLAQGHGYPPDNLTSTLDLSNPLRRDTASVEAFGWILLRFIADNPGAWVFHCHVSWHTEAGLLMQFLTRYDALESVNVPEANRALCDAPVEELKKGAGPPDEAFYWEIGD